ncbi:MAG: ABC transporter permease subunit [Candidatus Tectomicrobia bacterium]|uniref:ABC transporter permease subunit n=1 Tax=Tectimicrobiota bacterium TaxID=2528274 RepID=A0A932FXI3_UNCTE|nr:ABC transporter permease subunit [Candidatus Tectomicrobia bacterium]
MNLFPILQREFKSYFVSPIAYIVTFIFLLVSGYFFYTNFAWYAFISLQMAAAPEGGHDLNLTSGVLSPLFLNMSIIMLLMMPLLTMRLFSEEKKTGTIELLLTYPIRDGEALLGKFAACLAVFAVMLALTLFYVLLLALYGEPEYGPVITGYLGLLMMGAAFISLGILASSWTENQIVAAAVSFGFLILFWAISWTTYFTGPTLGAVLNHLSLMEHLTSFSKGVIETKDVVYYLGFTFFCLFLTLRSLESKRWRG